MNKKKKLNNIYGRHFSVFIKFIIAFKMFASLFQKLNILMILALCVHYLNMSAYITSASGFFNSFSQIYDLILTCNPIRFVVVWSAPVLR